MINSINTDEKKNSYKEETYSEIKKNIFKTLLENIVIKSRYKFFEILCEETNYTNKKTFLDIGTTPSLDRMNNVILYKTKNNKNVTCLSNLDCKVIKKKFPNIKKLIKSDGRNNNLQNNKYEIVHSNATLEHVGSKRNQILFVKECLRVSKKYVFIQTPNRFYPIDFHTCLPIIHWLPKKIHRKILKFLGYKFYSKEKNLNLLSNRDLIEICKKLKIDKKKFKIIHYKLLFFTSNLLLVIKKF